VIQARGLGRIFSVFWRGVTMLQRILISLVAAAGLLALFGAGAATTSMHRFDFTSIDGEPLPMREFAGRAVLVVNTASLCGFTYQYEGLQAVWETYRERGLVVLGVPSNDFGRQEPGSAAEIKDFCEVNFNVEFPLTAKQVVSGDGAHPFFREAVRVLGPEAAPRWNFHKFLVAPDGDLIGAWPSRVEPGSPEITRAIETALPK